MNRFRGIYGAGPLHLISLLACLAFAGYLVWTVLPAPDSIRILVWVAAGAVAHDLVLWPFYAITDRIASAAQVHRPKGVPSVPWVNHLRVPAVLSAVTLLISFPLILRQSEHTYHVATGLTEHPYLGRWLLLTGTAFAISGFVYAARLILAIRNR